jgi:hypothetical protein
MVGGTPLRGTAVGDLIAFENLNLVATMLGAKLSAGAAAASAQLVDADGTVLGDLAAPANGADYLDIPVKFRGKVRIAAIAGAGAIVNAWIE